MRGLQSVCRWGGGGVPARYGGVWRSGYPTSLTTGAASPSDWIQRAESASSLGETFAELGCPEAPHRALFGRRRPNLPLPQERVKIRAALEVEAGLCKGLPLERVKSGGPGGRCSTSVWLLHRSSHPHPSPLPQGRGRKSGVARAFDLCVSRVLVARKTPHRIRPRTADSASPPGEGEDWRPRAEGARLWLGWFTEAATLTPTLSLKGEGERASPPSRMRQGFAKVSQGRGRKSGIAHERLTLARAVLWPGWLRGRPLTEFGRRRPILPLPSERVKSRCGLRGRGGVLQRSPRAREKERRPTSLRACSDFVTAVGWVHRKTPHRIRPKTADSASPPGEGERVAPASASKSRGVLKRAP